MFGFGGGSNYGGPGEGANHFGGSGLGTPSGSDKDKDRSVSKSTSDKDKDRSVGGGHTTADARSVDRQGVTGYAGDSKTHEQDVAEAHADRRTGVGAPGQRMSTNVEGMTAQDFADRYTRQVGGMVNQTNTALRSNDLMQHLPMESTYDTRYPPRSQEPFAPRMVSGHPLSMQAGQLRTFEDAPLGAYRTSLPEIDYSFPTAAQMEIDRQERMYPNGPPGMMPNGLSYNPQTGLIERVR